ncbi:hypothetical protein [Actinomyces dentalis]|uniref:hypothetical protein n=1 Tax=Actinomyces dentalis TaxID=272548 RepID=UPI00041AA0F3|nr:hypothetical protein [Actinomyces dentalis]
MDERARQGAERLRRAAARTGGALSQAAGRAAEHAGAWGRAAGQAGQAASQVAGQVAGQAARAADAARSALPGGIRSGQEFKGTLFQRRLATALATRPHARSLGTNILGASPLRTGLSLGWRRKRTLEREGFDTTVAPGGVLDADELIHIHGRRLPRIMSNGTDLIRRHQDKELQPTEFGSATGSLHRVTVSEADRRRGAVDWDRLCVDTNAGIGNQHVDVLVAPIGRDGAEYAADMGLLLPEWLPPRAAQALVARPDRPTVRLHLLGEDRVGVDDGARFRLYEGVPHAMCGSLVMTSGRATRAELWISDRRNIGSDIIDLLGDLADLGEIAAAF